jgi:mono/diheme cytochrome c family protein
MNRRLRLLQFSACWILIGSVSQQVLASGSTYQRPPRVITAEDAAQAAEKAKLALGQRLYNGRVKPGASEDAMSQKPRLEALQALLPAAVAKKKDLPAMAGKLTPEQLEALEAYVNRRHARR